MDAVRAYRLRAARRIASVDALGDLSPAEWLLTCALNDLLQVANPSLPGWFDKDRPRKLAGMAETLVRRAGPPRRVSEALARYSTFSRVPILGRVDTTVSWWVGSDVFRGQQPPPRLLRWRGLRRVRTREERVGIEAMAPEGFEGRGYGAVLALLQRADPLTDLATAARAHAPFVWTGATLALISSTAGRNLARRVLLRVDRIAETRDALVRAHAQLPRPDARELVETFLGELGS